MYCNEKFIQAITFKLLNQIKFTDLEQTFSYIASRKTVLQNYFFATQESIKVASCH